MVFIRLSQNDGLSGRMLSCVSGKAKIRRQIDLTFSGLTALRFEYTKLQPILAAEART